MLGGYGVTFSSYAVHINDTTCLPHDSRIFASDNEALYPATNPQETSYQVNRTKRSSQ